MFEDLRDAKRDQKHPEMFWESSGGEIPHKTTGFYARAQTEGF